MSVDHTPTHIRLDKHNHVEKPVLDQLVGLGWEAIDRAEDPEQYGKDATE